MNANGARVLIDFLVPARLASRYRASVTALSPIEAEISFPFCPSIFGSGVLVSCPATLSLVIGSKVTGARGILWIGQGAKRTTARFQFEKLVGEEDLELWRHACQLDEPKLRAVSAT